MYRYSNALLGREYKWIWLPCIGNGYEGQHVTLLYVFVIGFGLDPAQATTGLEKCWSNWPIKTVLLNYSTRSVNKEQKIVQECGPSNINCSSFAITFEVRRPS